MPKKCLKCNTDCAVGATDVVSCEECGEVLHVACAGLDPSRKNTRNRTFKCGKCKDSSSVSSDNEESTVLKAIKTLRADLSKSFDLKLSKFEEKFSETLLTGFEKRISSLQESLNTTIKDIKSENQALRQDYDVLKTRFDDLSRHVGALTSQLQDLQQYSRVDNLEITGIPLTKNEDVYAILRVVAERINTPWRREDISIAHRLPAGRQKHPNIIIRFTSRTAKTTWLLAAKKLKTFTANILHASFPSTPVFVNEHLAAHHKAALSRAKHLVREKQLAFAWVKEGKVLVKKTPDGRATRVRSVADVEAAAAAQRRSSGGGGAAAGEEAAAKSAS
jgi:hypothetical protein